MRELAHDVLADLDVLDQVAGKLLLSRVPVRLPVVDDADAHPAGMNFLSHYAFAPVFLRVVLREEVCDFFAGERFAPFGLAAFSSATGSGGAGRAGTSRKRTVM